MGGSVELWRVCLVLFVFCGGVVGGWMFFFVWFWCGGCFGFVGSFVVFFIVCSVVGFVVDLGLGGKFFLGVRCLVL